jgi:type I restriction-modification system DNA methylase subunit
MSSGKIVTREQLKDHIHRIHDYIRNSGAGYGMKAMKMFLFFYTLRILEDDIQELGKKGKLTDDELEKYLFSKIASKCKNSKDDVKLKTILTKSINELLTEEKFTVINEYFNFTFPTNLDVSFYKQLIKFIDEIPKAKDKGILDEKYNVDLTGKIYEYFIGRDKTAISELGAYFTEREITNYIINKINPTLTDKNQCKTFIDPFGGSGGFTLSFVKKMNDIIEEKKVSKIKFWKDNENRQKIYHYDMEDEVIKICGIEFKALTSTFPFVDYSFKEPTRNFKRVNTFANNFSDMKFDYIFTNPPYGGDKHVKPPEQEDNEKIKEYIYSILPDLYSKIDLEFSTSGINSKATIKEINSLIDDHKKSDTDFIDTCNTILSLFKQLDEITKINKEIIKDFEKRCVNYDTSSRVIQDFIDKYKQEYTIKYKEDSDNERYDDKYNFDKDFKKGDRTRYANDKEACSLILLMAILAEGGICAGVLKEGVIFDSKYSFLREILIEHYNLKSVISIPKDQFENTTTKTTCLIFENPKDKKNTTKEVEFYELEVEKFTEDKFELIDMKVVLIQKKNSIKSVKEKLIKKVPKSEIAKPTITKNKKKDESKSYEYSLDYKKYDIKDVYCPKGYKFVKLEDLCKILPTTKHNTGLGKDEGKYRFYSSSQTKKLYCDEPEINKLSIILGNGGVMNIHIDNNFTASKHVSVLQCKNDDLLYYIYYYLKENPNVVSEQFKGSTLGWLNKQSINNIKISIPEDLSKLKTLLNNLTKVKSKMNEITEQIPLKEKDICNKIKSIIENGEKGKDYEEYKLNDVCEIKYGTRITKSKNENGSKYPVYGGGDITFYTDNEPNRTGFNCIIGRFGLSKKCVRLIIGNIYLNDSAMSIHYKKNNIQEKQLFYYLSTQEDNIYKNFTNTSVQTNINMDNFKSFPIVIIDLKTIIKHKLDKDMDLVDKLKSELPELQVKYNELNGKLFEPFKQDKNTTPKNTETENIISEDEISDSEEEVVIVKSTKSSDKKTKKVPEHKVLKEKTKSKKKSKDEDSDDESDTEEYSDSESKKKKSKKEDNTKSQIKKDKAKVTVKGVKTPK